MFVYVFLCVRLALFSFIKTFFGGSACMVWRVAKFKADCPFWGGREENSIVLLCDATDNDCAIATV